LFVFGEGKRRGEKRKKREEIEMFATAVSCWQIRQEYENLGLSRFLTLGEQVQSTLETLVNIVKEHEPSL
jgi:hypothetical protein